jgi:hypothetical protein
VTFFGPPFSAHLAGGAGSSARPKFWGQCARSALWRWQNPAGRPYRGYSFGRPSVVADGDSASAPEISRIGRRTQSREKVADRIRTPCTEMSFQHPAGGPSGGSVRRPTLVGQTSCQSSGPTDKSNLVRPNWPEARKFWSAIFAARLAPQTHPRDQNSGDSAPGRRFEKVNFPRTVPIRVTLLADWSHGHRWDSASAPEIPRFGRRTQPREKVTDRTRTPCTEFSFRHPARGHNGGSVRPPTKVGQTSCQSSGPTGKSDSSRQNWPEARKFWSAILAARLAPPTHPRDQNFGDSAPGRRFEKVIFFAGCPYRGYSFGQLSAITGWGGASARNLARFGRRTQWW